MQRHLWNKTAMVTLLFIGSVITVGSPKKDSPKSCPFIPNNVGRIPLHSVFEDFWEDAHPCHLPPYQETLICHYLRSSYLDCSQVIDDNNGMADASCFRVHVRSELGFDLRLCSCQSRCNAWSFFSSRGTAATSSTTGACHPFHGNARVQYSN